MRIYTAALVTETNSFSPFPTNWAAFEACGIRRSRADYSVENFFTESVLHVRRLGKADGHEVVLGPSAFADPAGPVLQPVYEALRDEILCGIEADGPFDAVILTLHGAMIAQGHDDCEGDLLDAVRGRVGPRTFVGAMLDPHCHLTRRMVQAADALITMKEYPHIDGKARLSELYRICVESCAGRLRPVSVLVNCRMVGMWPTTQDPIRSLVDRMRTREQGESILSISFAHGFPWGDVAEGGARVLAIADRRMDAAEAAALTVARDIYSLRDHARLDVVPLDDALAVIRAEQGLLVLADVADNPGGGAPGDSTFILRAALDSGLTDIAIGLIFDPDAVDRCRGAGIGNEVVLDLGGRHGKVSGAPVPLRARVMGYRDDHVQLGAGGTPIPLGETAWIEAAGIHIVVTKSRHQIVGPTAFGGLGLDLRGLKAVVVKSTNHFRAGFEPIASRILSVATPGALQPDFAAIAYRKRPPDYWPRCTALTGPEVIYRSGRR